MKRLFSPLLALLLALSLTACGMPMLEQTTVGGLTFTVSGRGRIERIRVTRGEEYIDTYEVQGLTRKKLDKLGDDSYGLILTNFNFDQMPDMRLKVGDNGTTATYACYLWDDMHDTYVYHPKLSSLENMGMIAQLEVITATESEHIIDPATGDTPEMVIEREAFVLYRWIDGELTEVHRKEKTYYEENDIYCYAVYERDEDGEMETLRESWIDADKMNEADYPMDATGFQGYVSPFS